MKTSKCIALTLASTFALAACGGTLEEGEDEFAITEDNLTLALNCQATIDFIRDHGAAFLTDAAAAYITGADQFGRSDAGAGEAVISTYDAFGAEGVFALDSAAAATYNRMFFRLTQVRPRFRPIPSTRLDISLTGPRGARKDFRATIESCSRGSIVAREFGSSTHVVLKFDYRSLIEG